MDQPSIGAVIGGMRLDSVAGAGGMGTVFKAFDLTLERTVALKVISASHAGDQNSANGFVEKPGSLPHWIIRMWSRCCARERTAVTSTSPCDSSRESTSLMS